MFSMFWMFFVTVCFACIYRSLKKKLWQVDHMKVLQAGKVKQPKSILCIYIISEWNLFKKVFLSWHFSTLLYANKIPLKLLVLYLDRYLDDWKAVVWLYYIHCLPLILHSIFTTAYYKGFSLLQSLCFDGSYKKQDNILEGISNSQCRVHSHLDWLKREWEPP